MTTTAPYVTEEITNPYRAAELLKTQPIRFAPGDGTLYRCVMIETDPFFRDRMLIMMVQAMSDQPEMIKMAEPRGDHDRWDAKRWNMLKLPTHWYGGAMPLLVGLGWAKPGISADYRPGAIHEVEHDEE